MSGLAAGDRNYGESSLEPEVDVEPPPQSEVSESRPSGQIPRWSPRFRFAPVAESQLLGPIILIVAIAFLGVMIGTVTTRTPDPAITSSIPKALEPVLITPPPPRTYVRPEVAPNGRSWPVSGNRRKEARKAFFRHKVLRWISRTRAPGGGAIAIRLAC
jgi:hypothetical protein